MTRRIMNRLYGRVYGWFDSKEARVITSAVSARFSTRARLALTNLEDRTVPATFVVLNDGDGSATGSLATQIAALDASLDPTNELDLHTNFTSPTTLTITADLPDITVPATVLGNSIAGVNQLTISGGGSFALLSTGTAPAGTAITFKNIDMTAGFTTGAGGGMAVGNQIVTLDHTSVSGCSAAAGGGIFLYGGGTLNIVDNSTISGNTATTNNGGGGIFMQNNSVLNIDNSTLTLNHADVFVPNAATGAGGAIHSLGGGPVTITNSTITGNTSCAGGAFYDRYPNETLGATLTISNSTFSNNKATGGNNIVPVGGGVFALYDTQAPGNGFSGVAFPTTVNITNSNITGNISTGAGGAGVMYIFAAGSSPSTAANITFTNCTISNNSTTNVGGVYTVFGGSTNVNTFTFKNSLVTGNISTNSGAVGYAQQNSNLIIDQSTFSGNKSTGASGTFFHNVGSGSVGNSVTVTNSSFYGNSMASRAGAIALIGKTTSVLIKNTTIADNIAGLDGGAFRFQSNTGTIQIQNCTITNNTAKDTNAALGNGGGAIATTSGSTGGFTINLTSTVVSGNSATNGDSDISLVAGVTLTGDHSLVGSTAGHAATALVTLPTSGATNQPYGSTTNLQPEADNTTGNGTGVLQGSTLDPINFPQVYGKTTAITVGSAMIDNGANTATQSSVQNVAVGATSGTFTLTFNSQTTSPLPFNDTALDVQNKLNGLSSIGGVGGSVTVTLAGSTYAITFGGSLANTSVPQLKAAGSAGVGVSVATIAAGLPILTTDQRGTGFPRSIGGGVDIGAV